MGIAFTKLGVAKFVVSGIVGIGTGKIVGRIIREHITPETLIDKITVTAAAWVIGALATEATKSYTNDAIDQVVETVTTTVNKFKLNEKVNRINTGESTFEKEGLDPSKFHKDENNVWAFSDKDETMVLNTVIGLIRSGDWTYDPKKDVWVNKESGRAFQQIKTPEGGTNWVWGRVTL